MPPSVKYQKKDVIAAALNVARRSGIDAVTAREVARELRASVGPIFSYYETMEGLRREVYGQAKEVYRRYVEKGLKAPVPFLGVWQQFLHFSREEPQLYRLLFLTQPGNISEGAAEALKFSQDLVRDSVMEFYEMDAEAADRYIRDLWLIAFSFSTMTVTGSCPYTDEEIFAVGAEVSFAVCKAYKEVPGMAHGEFDREAIFRELLKK